MSSAYFSSLSQLYIKCATKEMADFDAVGKRAFLFWNACINSYISGNQYKQRYPELMKKGSAVLLAFQECAKNRALSDNEKKNLETYNHDFEEDREECGDVKYLADEEKYFSDLVTPPPTPQPNTPPSQDKSTPTPGPATPPTDSSNTTQENKTPPTTAPKDNSNQGNNQSPPAIPTPNDTSPSKDSATPTTNQTPPPVSTTPNNAPSKDSTTPPNPTENKTPTPKDPIDTSQGSSPPSPNDPTKKPNDFVQSTTSSSSSSSSSQAAVSTTQGNNTSPPDNTSNKLQGNSQTPEKPADQSVTSPNSIQNTSPPTDPSKSQQQVNVLPTDSSSITSMVNPGAILNSFLGFSGPSSASPIGQQNTVATSSTTSNQGPTPVNNQGTGTSTNQINNTPGSTAPTSTGPSTSASTSAPAQSTFGLGGGQSWF